MKAIGSMSPTIEPLGDSAAIVSWPLATDHVIASTIQQLANAIHANWRPGLECVVPAFATLTVHYVPTEIRWAEVRKLIEDASSVSAELPLQDGSVIEIPVCYAEPFSPDLTDLAEAHGLSAAEVIRLHSEADYTVRMIGFSPGFPYLAGLPEQLATPRRSSPRLKVPAGSVAIGGHQAGVYSMETPGGWNIIGRTPTRLFCPQEDPPCLLRAGDRIRFVPIETDMFHELQART